MFIEKIYRVHLSYIFMEKADSILHSIISIFLGLIIMFELHSLLGFSLQISAIIGIVFGLILSYLYLYFDEKRRKYGRIFMTMPIKGQSVDIIYGDELKNQTKGEKRLLNLFSFLNYLIFLVFLAIILIGLIGIIYYLSV